MDNEVIIKTHVEKYSKRFWKSATINLSIVLLFFLFPQLYFNYDKTVAVIFSCFGLGLFIWLFFDYRKWTINAIESIVLTGDVIRLEYFVKDIKQTQDINLKNISTKLKWVSGRPRVLKLSILNADQNVIDFYSMDNSDGLYLLEDIQFKIRKKTNPNAPPPLSPNHSEKGHVA